MSEIFYDYSLSYPNILDNNVNFMDNIVLFNNLTQIYLTLQINPLFFITVTLLSMAPCPTAALTSFIGSSRPATTLRLLLLFCG